MPTVELADTPLEYIEKGEGEPLVLVHGTLGDFRSWELQMDPFARSHRTVSYSRRYHFPNPCSGDEENYSAQLHADDLSAFIQGLDIESAHVVGNSYGAYTALFLAMRHPARVRTLVLGEPPAFPLLQDDEKGRALRDELISEVWEPAGAILREGRLEEGVRAFVDGVVDEGAFDAFPSEVRELVLENACEFRVETSSPRYWTSVTCRDAERVDTPTLLLHGEHTLEVFRRVVEKLEGCIPGAERIEVPGSTHEMPADNPEFYNRTVLDFIARHRA